MNARKSNMINKFSLKLFIFVASLVVLNFAATAFAVDMVEVEKELTSTGVTGWIHGAIESDEMYVFTYRNPNDFFDYIEMSLTTTNADVRNFLKAAGRHDKVRVQGRFLQLPNPQKHIDVTAIQMVEKYTSGYPSDPYAYETPVPGDLKNLKTATFLVHAVAEDGHILVVEYKDAILPIFVKNNALTNSLYRGDVVELAFSLREYPDRPVHMTLTENAPHVVTLIDSVKDLHGKSADLEGALIMFPQSPEIKFNVFAVQQLLPGGLSRQFTLVNFDDPNVFNAIRTTLQKEWDKFPGDYLNGRNKLVSKKIRVHAVGTFNEVDPSQANPQILLNSVQSVEIKEQP